MGVMSAIVLFIVIWAMIFFIVLPFGQVSQQEAGDVVPGTPASAPTDAKILRKFAITTVISILVYAVVLTVLLMEWVTIDDLPSIIEFESRNVS